MVVNWEFKMAKRLFLLFCLIGLSLVPEFLTATDVVNVVGIDDSKAVETVFLSEPEPESKPEPGPAPVVAKAPVAGVTTTVANPKIVNYNVTIVTDKIVAKNLSYSDIYRTGKFIYAHNSSNLFGNLKYLNIGDVFTITESGVAQKYQVIDKVIYEKADNGYLNGSKRLTKEVEIYANGHDISIMTCSGTAYGNGDASHRLVLFANAV